ncbi:MAG: hypothetical protein WAV31_01715 [Candidatus Moraniibacteriota bacterium]
MYVIKTKDGDTLLMFKSAKGKVKILSCKRGGWVARHFVVFCKPNPGGVNHIEFKGDDPAVGLCFISYRYVNGKCELTYVSKEITEVS